LTIRLQARQEAFALLRQRRDPSTQETLHTGSVTTVGSRLFGNKSVTSTVTNDDGSQSLQSISECRPMIMTKGSFRFS
jgi:hypothetical protein